MLVPFAAAVACFLRREFRLSRWQAFTGGALLGLARWISPETMPLVLAAMCWLLLVPDALSGPIDLIPDELRLLWYGQIKELKSVEWPSERLAYLLLLLIAAAMLDYAAWQKRSLWMLVLAASTLIYAVLGSTHIRMGAAAEFISALAFSIGLSKIRAFISLHNSNAPLREQLLCAFLILSLPL